MADPLPNTIPAARGLALWDKVLLRSLIRDVISLVRRYPGSAAACLMSRESSASMRQHESLCYDPSLLRSTRVDRVIAFLPPVQLCLAYNSLLCNCLLAWAKHPLYS